VNGNKPASGISVFGTSCKRLTFAVSPFIVVSSSCEVNLLRSIDLLDEWEHEEADKRNACFSSERRNL
jgi:hypothetical protein